jgi:hypothetical protein
MKERQGLVLVRPLILRGGSKLSRASGMSHSLAFRSQPQQPGDGTTAAVKCVDILDTGPSFHLRTTSHGNAISNR